MDQVNFNYSMKNIPIPSKQDFLIQLISSSEKFLKNISWKAFFFLNPTEPRDGKNTFGFNSTKAHPSNVPELKPFKDKMYELVRDVKFKAHKNTFQHKLKEDITKVNSDEKMYIPADKTTNFYKVDKDTYNEKGGFFLDDITNCRECCNRQTGPIFLFKSRPLQCIGGSWTLDKSLFDEARVCRYLWTRFSVSIKIINIDIISNIKTVEN